MTKSPLLDLTMPLSFDAILPSDIPGATKEVLQKTRDAIDEICNAADAKGSPLGYEETLGAIEQATSALERMGLLLEHLESVATSAEYRAVFPDAQVDISRFWSSLPLHPRLYAVLARLRDDNTVTSPLERRHLDKTLKDFERMGSALPADGKARLLVIDEELTRLTTRFSQNVLDATNAYELCVDDDGRLAGLPESALSAARASAESKGKTGYRFTLHAPSFIPAITYLEDRELRRELYSAYNGRASSGEVDNAPVIREILRLRREKAVLLGFENFADLVTADRMAKTGQRARTFIDDLRVRTESAFVREKAELVDFAGGPLEAWDVAHYAEKRRKALFDVDEEALRPYFPLDHVLSGLFDLIASLYEVRLEPHPLPTWHPAVRTYRMVDLADDKVCALVYVDVFPRESKTQGAWMAPLTFGAPPESPHVAVVCANFTPPLGDAPALLTHREVLTLFHEFGHLLHVALSRVKVRSLSATNVAWDFVELPSQIHENWVWERETLDRIGRHHQTGEAIPPEMIEKMRRARTYRSASAQMQQLGYASVDLDLHVALDPTSSEDISERARRVLAPFVTARVPSDYAMVSSFGHLFGSPTGYAAGYYAYKWAEVLDADAFDRFRREGIFNPRTGSDFREAVLSKGNSEEPEVLFERFMGRPASVDALLSRLGLSA